MHSNKIFFIKQLTPHECGVCCCAMILYYWGYKININSIREELDVGRDGLTIKQMKDYLQAKDFDTNVYKIDSDINKLKKIGHPFIAYWENKHYVVIEKINKNFVIIDDPSEGRAKISLEKFLKSFSNYIVVSYPNKNFKPIKEKVQSKWAYILSIFKEKKAYYMLTFLLALLTHLSTLGIPFLIQNIINEIIDNVKLGNNYPTYFIAVISIFFFFILVISLSSNNIIKLSKILSEKLDVNTFKKLLQLPYKYFETRNVGDLLCRLNNAREIREIISIQVIDGIISIGEVFIILLYMFMSNIKLAFLVLFIFIIYLLYLCISKNKISNIVESERIKYAELYTIQTEAIYAIHSIKMSCLENDIFNAWHYKYKEMLKSFLYRLKFNNKNTIISNIIQLYLPILLLLFGVVLYTKGEITIGEIVSFQAISSLLFGIASSIFSLYSQFVVLSSHLNGLNDIWFEPKDNYNINGISKPLSGNIEVDNISFSYTKNSEMVLKNISLKIKSGQKIAIVGKSGSGKSTLSKIISGLYKPVEGNILYDNISINKYNKKSLYKHISIIPQDAILFNKTIFENIVMENKDTPLHEVKKICKMVCIHEDIEALPLGYKTLISKMGLNFSGGQRQRILLARALIKHPKILLMDEATGFLDNVNECEIMAYLKKMKYTRIIISHRLSTIKDSDVIFVIDNGKLVGCGKHDELLLSNVIYKELYMMENKKVQF